MFLFYYNIIASTLFTIFTIIINVQILDIDQINNEEERVISISTINDNVAFLFMKKIIVLVNFKKKTIKKR